MERTRTLEACQEEGKQKGKIRRHIYSLLERNEKEKHPFTHGGVGVGFRYRGGASGGGGRQVEGGGVA